jgi:acyl-CoA synthetase (AMP-forming)/AMP-acid ligase II
MEAFQLPNDPDHPALIMFTSGSTSKPKGVTHTHKSIFDTIKSRGETQRLAEDDITLVGTLICHSAGSLGMAFPSIYTGGTIVLLETFEPETWLESVDNYHPTRAGLLPTQLLDAMKHEKAKSVNFSSLKEIMVGGGMVSHDLYETCKKVSGLQLMEGYGLTECEGSCLHRYYELVKPGSVGKPRAGVEIRLVNHEGKEAEVGATGEIWIKSDSVMSGYWGDIENTRKSFAEGWLRTGDLGRRDEEEYLYFEGRIKEIIIKGGSNISPGEIEEVLDDHPDVVISGVMGVADEHYGELIHAFVEMKTGSQTSADL